MSYCQHCGAKSEYEQSYCRRYMCGTNDHMATGHVRSELCRLREEIQKNKFYKAQKRANKWTKKEKMVQYEDELPEDMTDIEYDRWFVKSKVVNGVRMGPKFERKPTIKKSLTVRKGGAK